MKKLLFIIVIGLLPFVSFSQKQGAKTPDTQENPFITFEYMHVKPGNDQAYIQVENFWRNIHLAQQKKGNILGWSVWEVAAPYNMNAPYQYVVTTVYPHFSDILDPYKGINIRQAFSGASEDSLSKMFSLTDTARDLIGRDIFSVEDHVGNTNISSVNYMMATYDKISPEKGQSFELFMKNHWIPMVKKAVNGGFVKFWWYGGLMFDQGVNSDYNEVRVALWDKPDMFDTPPPFAQYQKEDPAAFEGYKLGTRDRNELLHKVVSLDSPAK